MKSKSHRTIRLAAAARCAIAAVGAVALYAMPATAFGQPPSARKTTPDTYIGKHATVPEQAFWQQVVGKRIGRWYTKAPNGFPHAVALAQAAMANHNKVNAHYVMIARASGTFANDIDEEETLRRQYFPIWRKEVFKEKPDFWSVPTGPNPSVLGTTHFLRGFKGFITLSRELPRRQLSSVYDHELTHFYILSDKAQAVRNTSVQCLLDDGDVLETLVLAAYGELSEQNLEDARYCLQPAEIDVCLAEMKRRYVFTHKKQLDAIWHSPTKVWEWWRKEGARQSRESDEPATISESPHRFILMDTLPGALRAWLFKRMLEVV